MSVISEIGIKKLFGHLDYHIPLSATDNITIIHGPNGCGKTWILQIVSAVFSLDYSTLRSAPFDEIEFIFRDGGHFTVNRVHEERFPYYQQPLPFRYKDTVRSRLNFSYYSKRTKKPKEFSLGLPMQAEFYERHFPLSLLEREIPHLDRIGPREWFDTSQQLVAYKKRSVAPLIRTLSNENNWVRWEAAKALSQIGNNRAIKALLEALSDEKFEVRWLAAEGLIRIGRKAIVPLLEVLVNHSDSYWLREGIHHVLHDMNTGKITEALRPVLVALEGPEPSLEVPLAAQAALDALIKKV